MAIISQNVSVLYGFCQRVKHYCIDVKLVSWHSLSLLSSSSPSGAVPSFRGVCRRWLGDGDGRRPRNHLLFGGCSRGCFSRSNLRHPGRLHLPLHLTHARHRAALRLRVQLHGVPLCWDVPPVRHHGVSGWKFQRKKRKKRFYLLFDFNTVSDLKFNVQWNVFCTCIFFHKRQYKNVLYEFVHSPKNMKHKMQFSTSQPTNSGPTFSFTDRDREVNITHSPFKLHTWSLGYERQSRKVNIQTRKLKTLVVLRHRSSVIEQCDPMLRG